MALQRHEREDLLAEATALPTRGTWRIGPDDVFIGWRDGGAASIYWNSEPVLQLDSAGRIRRCYWRGERLAAVAGQLVWLRSTAGSRVQLQRVPLSDNECQQLLNEFASRISALTDVLEKRPQLIGATEPEANFRQRCLDLLRRLPTPLEIARRPGVGKQQKPRA